MGSKTQQLCYYSLSQRNIIALFFSRIAWRREEALPAPVGAAGDESFASGVALAAVEEAAVLSSRTFSAKISSLRTAHRVQRLLVNVTFKRSSAGAKWEMLIDDTDCSSMQAGWFRTTKSEMKPYLSLLDKEAVSFAAVKIVNPIDGSIVLPLVEVKLYSYPISGREISRPDEFDLQQPGKRGSFLV